MRSVHQRVSNDNGHRVTVDGLATRMADAIADVVPRMAFEDFERVLLEAANEAVRRLLEQRLQRLADGFGEYVDIRDRLYRRHQPGRVRYFSLCGPLEITRSTYRVVDQRNGPTRVPMELAAGLTLGATPALAFALAQGHAKAPIRSIEQDMLAAHRRPPSRSTMDRMARQLGGLVNDAVDDIEPLVRIVETVPAEAFALNVGLDRTSIPMEEAGDSGDTSKPHFVVRYRMAYVGTVCITDKNCEPLVTRRYAAPSHEDPQRLIDRMMADMKHVLGKRPDLNVGIVQDNAPEMWNRMRDAMRAHFPPTQRWRETVDRYHLMTRLAEFLEAVYPGKRGGPLRQAVYARWSADIDRKDGAVARITTEAEQLAFARSQRAWFEYSRLLGCYTLCRAHFRYASLKKLGLHTGSGVTEGACKSLIAARAKRSGQRWRMPGISAVLALRTLLDSDRLARIWPIFSARFHALCIDASRAA